MPRRAWSSGRPRWTRRRSLMALFGPPSSGEVVLQWDIAEGQPGEQFVAVEKAAEQGTAFAEFAVGVPPVLMGAEPSRAFLVGSGVAAVFEELIPLGFPGQVLHDPSSGLVKVFDLHQRFREHA